MKTPVGVKSAAFNMIDIRYVLCRVADAGVTGFSARYKQVQRSIRELSGRVPAPEYIGGFVRVKE
ncbi:hypothetical protein [Kushneria sp. EE4]